MLFFLLPLNGITSISSNDLQQLKFIKHMYVCTLTSHTYSREIFTLKDGGEVALDWMADNCDSNSPCVIILPGLTGNSQDEYVKCLVFAANNSGIRVVVFNNRGLGGVDLKTPRLYNACNCEDLAEVVQHVRKVVPEYCKLGATGISMGGLVLGK